MGWGNEENCPACSLPLSALLGGTTGRKKGHSRKLDSLREKGRYTSVRPSARRVLPLHLKEGRKEGRKEGEEHEDISWFVHSSIVLERGEERRGEESVSLARSARAAAVITSES